MSLLSMQGGATGTGTFTVLAPSTNTNRTLTLPDSTTTVVGTDATQTLTNKTLTSPTLTTPNVNSAQVDTVSGTAPLYFARAWVNFNGTGTVAIRASGNVSSITDNGTGNYTVNFTTAMPDVNYAAVATSHNPGTSVAIANFVGTRTTSSDRLFTYNDTGNLQDCAINDVAIFR